MSYLRNSTGDNETDDYRDLSPEIQLSSEGLLLMEDPSRNRTARGRFGVWYSGGHFVFRYEGKLKAAELSIDRFLFGVQIYIGLNHACKSQRLV